MTLASLILNVDDTAVLALHEDANSQAGRLSGHRGLHRRGRAARRARRSAEPRAVRREPARHERHRGVSRDQDTIRSRAPCPSCRSRRRSSRRTISIMGLEGGAEIYLTEPIEALELTTVVKVLLRLHSTERGLVQSEARWRSFVDSNIIGVVICRGDRIVEANDAFLRLDRLHAGRRRPIRVSSWPIDHAPGKPRTQRGGEPRAAHARQHRAVREGVRPQGWHASSGRWSAPPPSPKRTIAGWRSSSTSAIASMPRSSAKRRISASTRPHAGGRSHAAEG